MKSKDKRAIKWIIDLLQTRVRGKKTDIKYWQRDDDKTDRGRDGENENEMES